MQHRGNVQVIQVSAETMHLTAIRYAIECIGTTDNTICREQANVHYNVHNGL